MHPNLSKMVHPAQRRAKRPAKSASVTYINTSPTVATFHETSVQNFKQTRGYKIPAICIQHQQARHPGLRQS